MKCTAVARAAIFAGAVLLLTACGFGSGFGRGGLMVRAYRAVTPAGEAALSVELAETDAARRKGLSGRDSLPEGSAMLLMFPEDGRHAIWMKDMRFPLDLLYMNPAGIVRHIEPAVPPCAPETVCPVYLPPVPVRSVLEVPAGWCALHGAAVGTVILPAP